MGYLLLALGCSAVCQGAVQASQLFYGVCAKVLFLHRFHLLCLLRTDSKLIKMGEIPTGFSAFWIRLFVWFLMGAVNFPI